MPEESYEVVLDALAASHPSLAHLLDVGHRNRVRFVNAYKSGVRFKGLNQWLKYLGELQIGFGTAPELALAAPIVERVHADYEMAIEATLNGSNAVVHDCMRDVMEATLLIRDFAWEPANMARWSSATRKVINAEFKPVKLRERHAKRLKVNVEDLPETADYKAHSENTHLNPYNPKLFKRGVYIEKDDFISDMCFWEMFMHANGFVFQIDRLLKAVCPNGFSGPSVDNLDDVDEAIVRIREMFAIFMALHAAAGETAKGEAGR